MKSGPATLIATGVALLSFACVQGTPYQRALRLQQEPTLEEMTAGLEDTKWKVRCLAARACGAGGHQVCLEQVQFLAEFDASEDVRECAVEGLWAACEIGGRDRLAAIATSVRVSPERLRTAAEHCPSADAWLALMTEGDIESRISWLEKNLRAPEPRWRTQQKLHAARMELWAREDRERAEEQARLEREQARIARERLEEQARLEREREEQRARAEQEEQRQLALADPKHWAVVMYRHTSAIKSAFYDMANAMDRGAGRSVVETMEFQLKRRERELCDDVAEMRRVVTSGAEFERQVGFHFYRNVLFSSGTHREADAAREILEGYLQPNGRCSQL